MPEKRRRGKGNGDKLRGWRQQHESDYARALLAPPERTTLYRSVPFPGIILIMGHRQQGKSALAHEIISQFHQRKGLKAVMYLPGVEDVMRGQVKRRLPGWFKVVGDVKDWPRKGIILYDEASQSAHARRTQASSAITLDNILGISGQREQLIIFLCHHSRKLDLNIVHEVDRILWKMPTHAHAVFERSELADFTWRALEFFSAIKGDVARKKATLVMDFHNLRFAHFNNGLAPWWTEKLSKLFRDIELGETKTQ